MTGLRICENVFGGLHGDLEKDISGFYSWPKYQAWLDCNGALEEICELAFEEKSRNVQHSKFSNCNETLILYN